MLQETDPNGCWADEQATLEIGHITTLETAREQMKTFWKEEQPIKEKTMKTIPVKDVTDQLMSDFFTAFWKEGGTNEDDFMIEDHVQSGISSFRFAMNQKQHYSEGKRWEIRLYEYFPQGKVPIETYPHVKVRFKVDDPMDMTPYEEKPFRFVIYGNSIASDQHEKVQAAVKALVAKLEDRFPVVAEV